MAGRIEERIGELGLVLPGPLKVPAGVKVALVPVRVLGRRVLVSGHGPQEADGSVARPLGQVGADGQVGAEVTVEQAVEAARKVALAMLGSIRRAIGDLDRIDCWARVFGMVNSAPGFTGQTAVINGFSEQVVEIFGEERGLATRSAVGMAALPFGIPVEVEAELQLK
ncbi:MAG: RidA family protein [Gammaproteobacteria bacterium]|nr:RidA family protein [Gammaproteobacteria bacterium]MDE0366628.1 RidA family protein [Gammaproteobacteria bacterium]